MCRKRLSSPRCRSELIVSAWVVIVPGQKCKKKKKKMYDSDERENEVEDEAYQFFVDKVEKIKNGGGKKGRSAENKKNNR